MFTSAITESFTGFADVCSFTVGADEEIDDIFRFTVHLFLYVKRFAILHLDGLTFNHVRAVAAKRISASEFR